MFASDHVEIHGANSFPASKMCRLCATIESRVLTNAGNTQKSLTTPLPPIPKKFHKKEAKQFASKLKFCLGDFGFRVEEFPR